MATISDNTISPSLLASMNNSTKAATGTNTTAEAQDRFMKLLITQMQNQDPLNPMDNSQVTSQLAQLSTVTGIDKLNTTLEALQGSYQSSQSLASAGMIGHAVLVPGSKITLAESKGVFGVEMGTAADNVQVTIRNASGVAIHTIDLGAQPIGTVPMAWDGTTDTGAIAPDGKYTFDVSATLAGQKMTAVTALSFGQVQSVSTSSSGVKLNLPNMDPVSMTDVRQIL